MGIFTDESPMPFGKHKGEKLANVPADYLLYIYGISYSQGLKDYIDENRDVLNTEIQRNEKKRD